MKIIKTGNTKLYQFLYDMGICQFNQILTWRWTVILTTIRGYFPRSAVSHKEKRGEVNNYHIVLTPVTGHEALSDDPWLQCSSSTLWTPYLHDCLFNWWEEPKHSLLPKHLSLLVCPGFSLTIFSGHGSFLGSRHSHTCPRYVAATQFPFGHQDQCSQ